VGKNLSRQQARPQGQLAVIFNKDALAPACAAFEKSFCPHEAAAGGDEQRLTEFQGE